MSVNLSFKINIGIILSVVAVIFIFILRPFSCHSSPSNKNWHVLHSGLKNLSYAQAEPINLAKLHDFTPEIKDNTISTSITEGIWTPDSVYTPEDTLIVTASGITLADNTHWTRITIDGKPVTVLKAEYYSRNIQRRWIVLVETTNNAGIGAGIGYNLFSLAGIDAVSAVSISIRGNWIAPEVRIQQNIWSGIAIGAGIGYRFGDSEGIHLSAGVSLEI